MSSESSTSSSQNITTTSLAANAREALLRVVNDESLSEIRKADLIKKINFEGSAREFLAIEKIDLLHEEIFKQFEGLDFSDEIGPFKYDNCIVSSRFIILALFNYSIMADLLSYILSFDWVVAKDVCLFAVSAAINSRTIFMQSSEAANFVKSRRGLNAILVKVFLYKGKFNYGLFAAFGHILLETNMFNRSTKVRFYQTLIGASSLMRTNINNFIANSRSRIMVEVLQSKIDKQKIIALGMIAIGFIKIKIGNEQIDSSAIELYSIESMASCNVLDTNTIEQHIFRTKESIIERNKSTDYDNHFQIDNITRAMLAKDIITRSWNEAEVYTIKDKLSVAS